MVKFSNVFKDYGSYLNKGRVQRGNIKNFSLSKTDERFKEIMDKFAIKVPKETELKLPRLKKVGGGIKLDSKKGNIVLPNLKKV